MSTETAHFNREQEKYFDLAQINWTRPQLLKFLSEQRWAQHAQMAKLLHDGLAKMGLELYCPNPSDRLPTVTTIKIPDGFPWAKVNGYLMEKYALEIAGGLGPSAGKVGYSTM